MVIFTIQHGLQQSVVNVVQPYGISELKLKILSHNYIMTFSKLLINTTPDVIFLV